MRKGLKSYAYFIFYHLSAISVKWSEVWTQCHFHPQHYNSEVLHSWVSFIWPYFLPVRSNTIEIRSKKPQGRLLKDSTCWSVVRLRSTFACISTGCQRTAGHQRFSAVPHSSPALWRTQSLQTSLVRFMPSFSCPIATSTFAKHVGPHGPTQMWLCEFTWALLQEASVHCVDQTARCCEVTADLFSSWVHFLEVCWAHKSWGLSLFNDRWKKGSVYNASFGQI